MGGLLTGMTLVKVLFNSSDNPLFIEARAAQRPKHLSPPLFEKRGGGIKALIFIILYNTDQKGTLNCCTIVDCSFAFNKAIADFNKRKSACFWVNNGYLSKRF
jgi:hypothetical protein